MALHPNFPVDQDSFERNLPVSFSSLTAAFTDFQEQT